MVKYESLLLGGARKKKVCKKEDSSSSESEQEEMQEPMEGGKMHKSKKASVGKMSYEERCANLAKARAKRMANLKHKVSKISGKGQYNQDYVDESQINYAGSPLDMYYIPPKKEQTLEKEKRGENTGAGMDTDKSAMDTLTGGKVRRSRKPKMLLGGDMTFMKNSMHTGMSMPTEAEFKRGGKIMKEMPKVNEFQIDINSAINNLSQLASRFGLKLVKM